jgi:hypothetical protein
MGKMGHGYGSEWHLLRYLGRHRNALNQAIEQETGGRIVDWVDFPFDHRTRFLDSEWRGMDFLTAGSSGNLKREWAKFWPQRGNVQNWDAVGWLAVGSRMELLLVEAKAHVGEINTRCKAESPGHSRDMIRQAFRDAIQGFEPNAEPDKWLQPYYQYCNRLAALHFLREKGVPAWLIFIYFTGDHMEERDCPDCPSGWHNALQDLYDHIEFPWSKQQDYGIHKVFLDVRGKPKVFDPHAGR